MSLQKFYITTSIAYVNAKPHIGFAMELIQADSLARYYRLLGRDVFFLTGTDEHGMKMVQTAKDQQKEVQELVDYNAGFFQELVKKLDISADHFIRTTDVSHTQGARKLWEKMLDNSDIYKSSYEGLYCVGCEAFVLEKDLIDGKCVNHNKAPELLKEENYFFRLSRYSNKIQELIETDTLRVVPSARKHEILAILKDGLKDVSFSRPKSVLQWGIEVPHDPDHVMYVWCDALSNYITGIGYQDSNGLFSKFWPADIHLIGKDILRFHAAIWIGMLLSAGLEIPRAVYVHGYITSEGKKMSKSLHNVVDPVEYIEKYGVDALRYFLLKEIPTTEDGDFSKERFQVVYDSELANTFGNLVSRVIAMSIKYFEGKVPASDTNEDKKFEPLIESIWSRYDEAMESFDLKRALEIVTELAIFANKYVEDTKPWVLAKQQEFTTLAAVLYQLLEMIRHIAMLLLPFLPSTATRIFHYLGFSDAVNVAVPLKRAWGGLSKGTFLYSAEPLFMKETRKNP